MPIMPPGQGTGFNSISDYLDANRGTVANEQGALASDVGGQITNAQDASNKVIGEAGATHPADYTTLPDYGQALSDIDKAQQSATELDSQGGVSDLLNQHYGSADPSYTGSRANFDANLIGGVGVPGAGGLTSRAQSLTEYLNNGAASAAAPPQAPAPTPPGHNLHQPGYISPSTIGGTGDQKNPLAEPKLPQPLSPGIGGDQWSDGMSGSSYEGPALIDTQGNPIDSRTVI